MKKYKDYSINKVHFEPFPTLGIIVYSYILFHEIIKIGPFLS